MSADLANRVRPYLREILRIAKFESWSVDQLEDTIVRLFGGEVDTQPAPTPDQIAEPLPA
jgi:hypothetical protein